jgi:hypothetical protein
MLASLSLKLAVAPTTVDIPARLIVEGDFIYLFDHQERAYRWFQVAEVRDENGDQKVRLVGACYFIDESLIAAVAFLTGGGI